MQYPAIRLHCLILLLAASGIQAAPPEGAGRIEVIRDTWGIPHVFSETDAGAFYGLGHATAEERGFQMTYALRIMQGRLAEIIGDRPRSGRKEGAVHSDTLMRTLGWARAAKRISAALDQPTQALLEAYSAGVNDAFALQKTKGTLHPLFRKLGVEPEPWTPADCLLSWWHVGQFFATDGTRDLFGWRDRVHPQPGRMAPPAPSPLWRDDTAAVVQAEDTDATWRARVKSFATDLGFPARSRGPANDGPKFSHAWVVAGSRTTTGAAILVSDPQTPVRNPSLWMEFHISGKTFNVRGIGVPGSPGLLLGFNERFAWGLTALGADQADLFRLDTDADHPDQYRWDDEWRAMAARDERIEVKGGDAVTVRVRETHFGPVASAFAFRNPGDPEVALRRIPLCETNHDTIEAALGLMRARSTDEAMRAACGWRFPSANCVMGDSGGRIGFMTLGAFPIRSRTTLEPEGHVAEDGGGTAGAWRGFVPPSLVPQVVDPKPGFLLSANHRPAASFYGIPLGLSTGSMGDTMRSWRLRERLLEAGPKMRPEDVLAIHFDSVNAARRELVRLALHLQSTSQGPLSKTALQALEVLGPWFRAGASSDLDKAGASLATRMSTFFRFVNTPLAGQYGGGESGLARFLKDSGRRIAADPKATFSEEERAFIDQVLGNAWTEFTSTPAARGPSRQGSGESRTRPLPWMDSLDGYGSLDPSSDLVSPPLRVLDGQTLLSQAGQSYTQWVPLNDPDGAKTVCPIGHSDRADSPYRTSTMALWGRGELHPAPLTRTGVERIAHAKQSLGR
jgi:penicillin amidase